MVNRRIPARPANCRSALQSLSRSALKTLNDRVVEAYTVVRALSAVHVQMEKGTLFNERKINFTVPSSPKKRAGIQRSRQQFAEMIQNCARNGEYAKSLTFCVAEAEDHIISILRLILRAYPDRLMNSIRGNDVNMQVELRQIISAHSIQDIIENSIRSRLHQALYAAPQQYLDYLRKIVRVELPKNLFAEFCEVKATRDIVVHAQGIANPIYCNKAGALARATAGELLPTDKKYFDNSVGVIKDLYGTLGDSILKTYGHDERVAKVIAQGAVS